MKIITQFYFKVKITQKMDTKIQNLKTSRLKYTNEMDTNHPLSHALY